MHATKSTIELELINSTNGRVAFEKHIPSFFYNLEMHKFEVNDHVNKKVD